MDTQMMNETRKTINKIGQQRKELPSIDDKKKNRFPDLNDKTKDKVEGWCKNIRNLNGDIGKQVQLLDGMGGYDGGGIGKGGEVQRNYMGLIIMRLQKDVEDIINICKRTMVLNQRKTVADEEKNNQDWILKKQEIRNEATKVLSMMGSSNSDASEGYYLISKLLNMRDNLQQQIFYSCLYRKLLVWNDLNIHCGEYCPQKVVDCIKQINDFQERLDYKPTKLQFRDVTLESPGYFSYDNGAGNCESTESLDALIENIVDMEVLIKKNFLLVQKAPEKINEFINNNPVQKTMREEVEIMNQQLSELKLKNNQMIQQFYSNNSKNNDQGNSQVDTQQQLDKYKAQLQLAEITIQEKDQQIENLKSEKIQQRKKLKDVEEKAMKYENNYLPKLKETKIYQREIYGELENIRNDAELLPWMFRAEAVQRRKYKYEKDNAVEKMNSYKKDHFNLVSERDDLKNELGRKMRLAQQAIAARGNIKQYLDNEKQKNDEYMDSISKLNEKVMEAEKEVKKFKSKHDEMFASVSGLNARIEELEQHKLHLLEKLKSYGDRGDLGYIVKTQKLGDIRAKEMKDRVQIEDYQPEKNRDKRDQEYQDKMAEEKRQLEEENKT